MDFLAELFGATILMVVFYQFIRLALVRFIVIETHGMLISSVLSGVIGEIIWYLVNGFISLYFILGAFIVYIVALINYNMVVDNCIVCGKDIEDIDLVFITEDGNGTACSTECNFEYEKQKNNL